jgi:hypothetical protein
VLLAHWREGRLGGDAGKALLDWVHVGIAILLWIMWRAGKSVQMYTGLIISISGLKSRVFLDSRGNYWLGREGGTLIGTNLH